MKSVMTHSFSQVPRAEIPRSTFNRSHGLKTTFDADYLVPILVDDVIPGDTFNVNVSHFVRLATPIHPIMDNLYIDTFYFYVPYRLLWDNWEKFCGAQDDPGDSIDYTIPVVSGADWACGEGYLWDYFGLPLDNKSGAHLDPDDVTVSALPFRAYCLIWNQWFKDQNLQNSLCVLTGDGPDQMTTVAVSQANDTTYTLGELVKRGKRHDYFTSCLPWPQKGTAVDLPLGTQANVFTDAATATDIKIEGTNMAGGMARFDHTATTFTEVINDTGGSANLLVDLSTATAATINDLRLAFQTQRLLERDARAGTRYNETILAHWGVTVPDFRVQRPEYLGGSSSPINITPVAQTTYQGTPTAEDAKGNLAAFGTGSGTSGFTKSFVEHGVIIGLVNARADITYSQGIERYWGKQTRYDFYYPVLSQIGEQSVTNVELWTKGDGATTDDLVFGYQERYAEYRYKPSRLTGLMSVDAASSLSAWHLSEDFATLPTLGDTFIQSNTSTPLDRAIAVPSEPQFIADFYFDMKCARPMPIHGVPGNLDHF